MISYYDDKNTIHNNFKHDLKEFSLQEKNIHKHKIADCI